jgi:uncharacterized lipoprotein YmbA
MKARYLILLALALVGCSAAKPHTSIMTAEQANNFARKLANEKAQALYGCQPFRDGPMVQFVRGYWVWHDRRGQGNADVEATVKFAGDGTEPNVKVALLYSRPEPPIMRR